MKIRLLSAVSILALTNAVFAHHSDAGLDEHTVVALQGRITEFSWRQPHVYFSVETQENGQSEVWTVQLAAVNVLSRRGWNKNSLTPGEEVIARVNPATSGKRYGKYISVVRADGSPVAVDPGMPVVELVAAPSLHGKWTGSRPDGFVAPRPEPAPSADDKPPCTTGFDCFFKENLVLTDAGIAARDAFDPLSSENPEASCVGRPTPSAFMSARLYLLQFDLSAQEEKIIIRSEWFNEERTIWMDGRDHPAPSKTLVTGHSVGHWDGDTLVVDTSNFDDHRSPYQIGVPSGAQKHVVEKYRLSDDKKSLHAEYTLNDPEFLAEPLNHKSTWYYAPHMEMLATNCVLENTGRFVN